MGALATYWKSERGLLAILLVLGATALTWLGDMTIEQWLDYTKWIFGFYAGSKTLTGAVGLLKGTSPDAAAPAAPAAPPAPASAAATPPPTPAAEPPKA
jgi:hypothetical protein